MSDEQTFDVEDPGRAILGVAEAAEVSLLLVSPFVKVGSLIRVLESASPAVTVRVITRWHLAEIIAGVSDLEVWPVLRERGAQLRLRRRLHAKMYLSEVEAVAGSANLTGAALGWSRDPNDEVVVPVDPASDAQYRAYAERLWNESIPVDDTVHQLFTAQASALQLDLDQQPEPQDGLSGAWTPRSRDPTDVVSYYVGDLQRLTPGATVAARADLQALETPVGLSRDSLHVHVSLQLIQHPLVRELEQHLQIEQRFGDALRIVRDWSGQDREDGARTLQTMMRWLLYFQPTRWSYRKANYSEIFTFVGLR